MKFGSAEGAYEARREERRRRSRRQVGYENLALSPDGKRLALTIEGQSWNVWTLELARGILTRLTFDNDNRDPWSADGKRVVYTSFRKRLALAGCSASPKTRART
jgi:Tol biopolymer transport system component